MMDLYSSSCGEYMKLHSKALNYQSQDTCLRDNRTVSALHKREGCCSSSGSASPNHTCILLKKVPKPPSFSTHSSFPCQIHSADPKMEEGTSPYIRRKEIQREKSYHSSMSQAETDKINLYTPWIWKSCAEHGNIPIINSCTDLA